MHQNVVIGGSNFNKLPGIIFFYILGIYRYVYYAFERQLVSHLFLFASICIIIYVVITELQKLNLEASNDVMGDGFQQFEVVPVI
jgi:hypothetical protein